MNTLTVQKDRGYNRGKCYPTGGGSARDESLNGGCVEYIIAPVTC